MSSLGIFSPRLLGGFSVILVVSLVNTSGEPSLPYQLEWPLYQFLDRRNCCICKDGLAKTQYLDVELDTKLVPTPSGSI